MGSGPLAGCGSWFVRFEHGNYDGATRSHPPRAPRPGREGPDDLLAHRRHLLRRARALRGLDLGGVGRAPSGPGDRPAQRGSDLRAVHGAARCRALLDQHPSLGQRGLRTGRDALRLAADLVQVVRVHPHRAPPQHQRRRQRPRPLRQWRSVVAGPVPVPADGRAVPVLPGAQREATSSSGGARDGLPDGA